MKVKSESEVAQLCLTLRDPMVCSLPGSSVRGIFQERVLEWGAIAFSMDSNTYTENINFCHLKFKVDLVSWVLLGSYILASIAHVFKPK